MKERFEWVQSWCDETQAKDLPRVLLIGDSITRQYQQQVREKLSGKWYVDYLSMSYSVDSPMYATIIKAFLKDTKYNVIHFNNGLHGFDISGTAYKAKLKKMFGLFPKTSKVILATTTCVNKEGNECVDTERQKKIAERNLIVKELSEQNCFELDDLYSISTTIKKEERAKDGIVCSARL